MDLMIGVWCGLDLFSTRQELVAGFFKYDTQASGSMKAEEFPGKFNSYSFLNKDSVA